MASEGTPLQVATRSRNQDHLALVDVDPQNATAITDATQPRRKRASKPKVRTGCTTCKIRRVKCDETQPSCNRCTSTGRKCDGYEFTHDQASSAQALTISRPQAPAPRHPLSLPSSISVTFSGTAKERRIFHRFQVRTIPAFAGSSELEFWESLVLKVGQQEPVVRNAIVALGTLHEDYQRRDGKHSQGMMTDPSYQRALSLYGEALRRLNERLDEGNRTSAKVALISSILFTCFEVLRRNSMAAIIHYQAGMRELCRQIKSSREDEASSFQSSSSAVTEFRQIPEDELDVLQRVFVRYDVQGCTFGKPRVEGLAINLPPQPPTSMTLPQVILHLDNLLISVYQFIKSDLSIYRYWPASTIPTDWLFRRDSAIATFGKWLTAIETFFQNSLTPLRPPKLKSLLGLRMQVKIAIILLKTCIDSPAETSFDVFLPEFNDIVTRIEEMADSLSLREGLPLDNETTPFTMELGILHPLFFVATKCRHPSVRRRAIAALKRGGREGVWEGPIVALVAEWVVRMEEEEEEGSIAESKPGKDDYNDNDATNPDHDARLGAPPLLPAGLELATSVPEKKRIHDIRKTVDCEGRRVLVEAQRSVDLVEWKTWELVRDSLPF